MTAPPVTDAFFRIVSGSDPELLQPLPSSASGWSPDHVRGMAVSGALARATEHAARQQLPDMRPSRWTVDLYRPARARPSAVHTTLIRRGRRIGLIDAELSQGGQGVARARAVFVRPTPGPTGPVWNSDDWLPAPPSDMSAAQSEGRLYFSEQEGWTTQAKSHHNDSRKQIWHFPIDLVEGEQPTPFQFVASIADVASLAINWGTDGMEFINADIDLALTRLPVAMEVGLRAVNRTHHDGISAGSAVVFDRDGPLGTVSTVALANTSHRIDPGDRHPDLSAFSTR